MIKKSITGIFIIVTSLIGCEETKAEGSKNPCTYIYRSAGSSLQCNATLDHCILCTDGKCLNFNPNKCWWITDAK